VTTSYSMLILLLRSLLVWLLCQTLYFIRLKNVRFIINQITLTLISPVTCILLLLLVHMVANLIAVAVVRNNNTIVVKIVLLLCGCGIVSSLLVSINRWVIRNGYLFVTWFPSWCWFTRHLRNTFVLRLRGNCGQIPIWGGDRWIIA